MPKSAIPRISNQMLESVETRFVYTLGRLEPKFHASTDFKPNTDIRDTDFAYALDHEMESQPSKDQKKAADGWSH